MDDTTIPNNEGLQIILNADVLVQCPKHGQTAYIRFQFPIDAEPEFYCALCWRQLLRDASAGPFPTVPQVMKK